MVRITRYVVVHDCGRVINPLIVEGQIQGGVAHGIGNALRIWDGWAHDWPYWERMIRLYIGGHD